MQRDIRKSDKWRGERINGVFDLMKKKEWARVKLGFAKLGKVMKK